MPRVKCAAGEAWVTRFVRMAQKRARDEREASARRAADRKRLDQAAELYLHSCYKKRRPARAEEFAEDLRLRRPYLSRLFPELIGMPVSDFLRTKQLAHAQRLLRTTPLSIEHVALCSGFGNEWTFQRRFKAAFGVTPAEYRKNVTK